MKRKEEAGKVKLRAGWDGGCQNTVKDFSLRESSDNRDLRDRYLSVPQKFLIKSSKMIRQWANTKVTQIASSRKESRSSKGEQVEINWVLTKRR
jgi:hypothetical protein